MSPSPSAQRRASVLIFPDEAAAWLFALVPAAPGISRARQRRGSRLRLCSDLECPGSFPGVVRMQAVGKALPVRYDGLAAWSIVASHVQDKAAASRAQGDWFPAEVARPPEQLQVAGPDAEPHPGRRVQPANLFHHRVNYRPDRRIHRIKIGPVQGSAELLDQVNRRSNLLMADYLDGHAPRLMSENPGPHLLPRKKCQAVGLETIHAEHSSGQSRLKRASLSWSSRHRRPTNRGRGKLGLFWADGDGMGRLPPQPSSNLDKAAASIPEPEAPAGGKG